VISHFTQTGMKQLLSKWLVADSRV